MPPNNIFLLCPIIDYHPHWLPGQQRHSSVRAFLWLCTEPSLAPSPGTLGLNIPSLGGRRFPSIFPQDLCSKTAWDSSQALLGWNPRDLLCVPRQVPSLLWACFPSCTRREWARCGLVPSDPWLEGVIWQTRPLQEDTGTYWFHGKPACQSQQGHQGPKGWQPEAPEE